MAPLTLRMILLFQLYPLLLTYVLLQTISTFPHKIPRLSLHHEDALNYLRRYEDNLIPKAITDDYNISYYTQTLDHFNYARLSYATFTQRYAISSKYWGGARNNSPIFAYLGDEQSMEDDFKAVGFLNENAPYFKSLSVFIEHRFYGKSRPAGSMEEALNNERLRGYFNSAQAIADYAEILLHIKQQFSALYSPIIVVGGSYGGMLASWFRLKYPHIALGALASSAPILYFDDITPQNGYDSIVTKDFKEISNNCYETIRKSWAEIDRLASERKGLSNLSQRFNTCSPLKNSDELKDFLESIYATAAQYDAPPSYPVSIVCKGIDGAPKNTDIVGRIFAGLVAYGRNKTTCFDINKYNTPSESDIGWGWQECSEIVMPMGRGENDTMFPASPFNLTQYSEVCKSIYGVPPRPHWVTTNYGGKDIKLVLKSFGSNIIFSNGLRDPYSSGGVLYNISKSIVAVTTLNGSHCLDILPASETDPEWLITQRKIELEIINGWLTNYYFDLWALKK
ncbi:hypothetical protein CASFOL_034908 [Castilleja foliolosa]|uniref:Lysosomal Pro-X carboxypeptidase n=1 Tax=Castilleja foliolosa TaxID=1961234 RepID=A0ABD3BSC3_9LAMI